MLKQVPRQNDAHTRPSFGPQDSSDQSQSDGSPPKVGSDVMEQNGASNGQSAKLQKSESAAGASKSPKKRRKVNHGTSANSAASYTVPRTLTDLMCFCSLCILSPICKYCIGSEYKGCLVVCAYA